VKKLSYRTQNTPVKSITNSLLHWKNKLSELKITRQHYLEPCFSTGARWLS